MHVERLNQPLFLLPREHIARQFLEAFIDCRINCVGREISYRGEAKGPIDQEWFSSTVNEMRRFSDFAYEYLSFDIVLDGWLQGSPNLTNNELADLERIPHMRELMNECEDACLSARNKEVLALVRQVLSTLDLWDRCIRSRLPCSKESSGQ